MFVGWCFALIGLNIQHDANHGALSRNPWVNRIWGASINWIGGSSISWIHQHVVQHHLFTNDVKVPYEPIALVSKQHSATIVNGAQNCEKELHCCSTKPKATECCYTVLNANDVDFLYPDINCLTQFICIYLGSNMLV
jgi:hypothetical protein